MRLKGFAWLGCLLAVLAGCAAQGSGPQESAAPASVGARAGGAAARDAIEAAVNHPDRPAKDREQDAKRRPVEMMEFFGVAPGQRILDMFSAGGWYAELLARAVGPKGQVYMQNPPETLARFGDKSVVERLAGERLANVVRWDKPLNEMELPAGYFDGVMINLVYHDFFWISKDVDDVTRDIYAALKPGGWVGVIDHAAPAGTGVSYATDPRGQHRIEEAVVRQKFEAAGFVLEAESDALRRPDDDRTKAFFAPEMKGRETDRFVMRFRKPR